MTHSIIQTLLETLTSPQVLSVATCCGALLAAHCGCGCEHDGGDDDDEDDGDLAPGFSFSREDLAEYKEFIENTNKRITEIVNQLDSGEESKELLAELVTHYLARAARFQEEGEDESAVDDYAAAFARYDEYVEKFDESLELLKRVAAGRLNHGILLNDTGELEDADEEYARAEEANRKLADYGDREATLDLNGIRLNRASIAFELGDHAGSLQTLDDAAEEFLRIAEDPETKTSEARYYLAKTYSTKATFLRSQLEEDDLDSAEAREATETLQRAIDVYRGLVAGGDAQYRRDLADALVLNTTTSPARTKEDLESALEALQEACAAYQQVVMLGEQDACVDLFDATLQSARILKSLDRNDEALKLYDSVIDTYESFAESGELPLVEGLASAYQNRATLRKGKVKTSVVIDDLTHAIELQTAIAGSLMSTLKGDDDHDGCCCGHDHGDDHECRCGHDHGDDHECCCGHDHGDDHECCCGHDHGDDHECCCGHDHDGDHECCCGHDHEHEGCGCCGDVPDRQYLVEHWVNDNFKALMECFYERINAYLENHDSVKAVSDCVAAEELAKAYRLVLKEGETLDDEVLKDIRTLRQAF